LKGLEMNKISSFVKTHLPEITGLMFLLFIYILLAFIFWGHQGSLIIDCGRETYLPSEVLKGKVLYKDIFNIYGPLAYQFNAFLYGLFGEKLETLYAAGLITAGLIIATLYTIARLFTSKAISWSIAFFVTVVGVFNTYIFNYVFPYSYALTYALCTFLLSVLALLFYIKSSKPWLVPISFLFIGISSTNKYEYTLYILFLAIFTLLIKPVSKKYLGYSLISFLIVPIISFFMLFIQGLRLSDLIDDIQIIKNMLNSHTLKHFYSNFVGVYPQKDILIYNINNFFISNFYLFSIITIIYLFLALLNNSFKRIIKVNINIILKIALTIAFLIFFPYQIITKVSNYTSFSWIPLSTAGIFIFFLTKIFVNAKGFKDIPWREKLKQSIQSLTLKDKMFMSLCFIAFLSSLKSFFFLNLNVYGSFIIPLIFLVNVVFLAEYLPKYIPIIDKSLLNRSISITIIVISLFFLMKNIQNMINHQNFPLKTAKGTIYTSKSLGITHYKAINYINNIPTDASILIIPEGPMLNFLTNRPSDDIYYSLLPIYVETFGEDNIIKGLSKNPPDYIFLNNRDSSDYGFAYFCRDYGFKICNHISENYTFEKEIGTDFKFWIYKRKYD